MVGGGDGDRICDGEWRGWTRVGSVSEEERGEGVSEELRGKVCERISDGGTWIEGVTTVEVGYAIGRYIDCGGWERSEEEVKR